MVENSWMHVQCVAVIAVTRPRGRRSPPSGGRCPRSGSRPPSSLAKE